MVNMEQLELICRGAGAEALPIMWSWLGVCSWSCGDGTETRVGERGYRPKRAQIWGFRSLDKNRTGTPANQTCLRPPRGGCLLRHVMLSPPWPAGLGRPAERRGRRGRRRWWRRGGLAGSGPAAEGSWAEPGPGAETAGEPGAAAVQNDNQTQLRHSIRDGAHKSLQKNL